MGAPWRKPVRGHVRRPRRDPRVPVLPHAQLPAREAAAVPAGSIGARRNNYKVRSGPPRAVEEAGRRGALLRAAAPAVQGRVHLGFSFRIGGLRFDGEAVLGPRDGPGLFICDDRVEHPARREPWGHVQGRPEEHGLGPFAAVDRRLASHVVARTCRAAPHAYGRCPHGSRRADGAGDAGLLREHVPALDGAAALLLSVARVRLLGRAEHRALLRGVSLVS
mmetsp:Transcript_15006/g.42593  ORF Transcript_15006/g.42593 Transcript_15006/m.42593 type:complete len:221 (-) Transcript_15006:636-1298(-)